MTKEKLYKAQAISQNIDGVCNFIRKQEELLEKLPFDCSMSKEENDFIAQLEKQAIRMKLKKAEARLASLEKELDRL